MITARAPWRVSTPSPGLLSLATAGAAAAALVLLAPLLPVGGVLHLTAPGRVLLLASAAALLMTTILAPHRVARAELLAAGLGALGGQALILAVTEPLAVAALLLLIGCGFAARPGLRTFVERARRPAFAALLIGVGSALAQLHGAPSWTGRAGALAFALALAAVAGLVPYLASVSPEEPASSSFLAWTGFFGPALAIALPARALEGLSAADAGVFGSALVGLGLVNLGWGTIAAWRTASDVEAWRSSFLVDWGLALVGVGLFLPDGLAAAYLALLGIVLVRGPLYLWARPALLSGDRPRWGAVNVAAAVLLAGGAPFMGFPVRLLVVSAASQTAWPLAVPLVAAMLLGIVHAVRLARTIDPRQGWAGAGLWLTMGLGLLLGVVPGVFRAAVGL